MKPQGAHLVGSVPLAGSAEVFSAVAQGLGSRLKRIPDGETGPRSNWIAWQLAVFEKMPQLESEVVNIGYLRRAKFRVRKGVAIGEFPELGYSRAALESYRIFRQMRDRSEIPGNLRFQVCLPTPLAPLHAYVFPESMVALLGPYETRMRAELDEILARIPHPELAIQWDTAIEFAVLEGVMPTMFRNAPEEIFRRLTAYGNWVPRAVELGYHLCYGDSGHKHFKEPADAAWLVRVANHLAAHLERPLDFLHLPVPRERFDDAYYRPLAGLALQAQTELYLGLVHMSDGVAGTERRIAAAQRHVARFGVATECGLGRRPAETVKPLMEIHTAVSQAREEAR
jgi:hypothetical protein